jgi:3-methyladenine DNA glycosylase/8-oxoguanine DNA glycosylase
VILGQQVSVKAAHTLMGRLASRCPGLEAGQVAASDLSTLGLPARRLQTLRLFAERVAAGAIRFDGRPWDEVAGGLVEVPGFGPWTLQYLAIRLGRDRDAFPEQDLGLMRATGAKSPRELLRLADAWRPYRAYAAMCLWMVE